jgi:hypothetical protein
MRLTDSYVHMRITYSCVKVQSLMAEDTKDIMANNRKDRGFLTLIRAAGGVYDFQYFEEV